MPDQFQCEHGHRYYDGDQGVGSPYDDGWHDRRYHIHDDGVADYDPWGEREAYEQGFADAMPGVAP
jgi:hypothetical protein